MLARYGVEIISQMHHRAAASHWRGNLLSALALVGIADTAGAPESCQALASIAP
jgi:hypothetical protein